MALKLLIAALLVSAGALAGPIFGAPESKPSKPSKPAATNKNPLDREWLILMNSATGFTVAVDPTSFTVLTPGDEFTFVTLMILGKNSGGIPAPRDMPTSQVSTVKVSCSKKQAAIIADTLHDDAGKIIGTDEVTKTDKMGPFDPTSIIGKIATSVCSGQSLIKTKEKEYKRGDSIKSA